MPIHDDKRKIIERCVLRLTRKNSTALHLVGSAVKGLFSGNFSRQLVSHVFDFDPRSELPVEHLIAEALLNGLEEEDIEEVFKRYASRKDLEF